MNSEIIKAALDGLEVTITPDCWPDHCPVHGIRVITAAQIDNRPTVNRGCKMVQDIKWGEFKGVEIVEEYVNASVREMVRVIRTGDPAGEWALKRREIEERIQATRQKTTDAQRVLRIVEDYPLTVDDVEIYARFCQETGLHGETLMKFLRDAIITKREGKF